MTTVLNEMEVDDDATTSLPGRRKRRIEDGPEQFFATPGDVVRNPMAPVKKRRQDASVMSVQPQPIPPQLPLQPIHPRQIPPSRSSQPHQPQPLISQPFSRASEIHRAAEPHSQHQSSTFQTISEGEHWPAQRSDPQTHGDIQSVPDHNVQYQPQQSELQVHPSLTSPGPTEEAHHHQQSARSSHVESRNAQTTTTSFDGPGLSAATDQPRGRTQNDNDDGYNNGADDGYNGDDDGDDGYNNGADDGPGCNNDADDIYETPRRSDCRPQQESQFQSPLLRPEGS